ncbi:MAG: hypothetical protein BroJett029_05460 [Alphaproteobacteria bacterium]|nr:MAG: hypothetical protein BroJett029_05460 [Alphaproteobacteria bacterium]
MRLDIPTNSLIRVNGTVHRFSHWTADNAVVLRDPQNGNCMQCSQEDFLRLFTDGLVQLNVPPADATKPWRAEYLRTDFSALPKQDQAEALRKKTYLDRIRATQYVGPQRSAFPPIIAAVAAELGDEKKPSWQTVARWMLAYTKANYDVRALVPGHRHKGCSLRVRCPEEMKILILCAQAWLDRGNATRQSFVADVETAYREAAGNIPGAHMWQVPRRSALYDLLGRIDPYEVMVRRHGKRAADEQLKLVDRKRHPRYRLEVVEIDHTTLDIYVVDPKNRLLLGRPTITAAIDVHTRMIVGFYIGFEPAGTYAVMQCLRNMILPKTYVRQEWPDLTLAWNPCGVPCNVLVDNAIEFRSESFRHVAQVLGITIEQAPVGHPEFKGTIERFFRTLKDGALTRLPGKPIKPTDKAKNASPEHTACVSLDQLRKMLHYWLIAEYCHTTHTGIMDVPQRRWEAEDRTRPIALPKSLQDLEALLGKLETATLTREGIRFCYLRYKSDVLAAILRAEGGSVEVSFKYDPGNLRQIHLIHPKTRQPLPIPVQEADAEYADGLSLFQHKAVLKFMRARNRPWENRAARLAAVDELRRESMQLLKKGRVHTRARHTRMVGIGIDQPGTDIPTLVAELEAEDSRSASLATSALGLSPTDLRPSSCGTLPTSGEWPSQAAPHLDAAFGLGTSAAGAPYGAEPTTGLAPRGATAYPTEVSPPTLDADDDLVSFSVDKLTNTTSTGQDG